MKKIVVVFAAFLMLMTATIVLADPVDYNKKIDKGIYYLVAKDGNWDPLPRSTNAFGKAKFSIKDEMLTMRLTAHKLTPDNWYMVEIVDWNLDWQQSNVLSDDRFSMFYGQADEEGNVHITFTWIISGSSNKMLEINLKNADNVALLDSSTYGVPNEWIIGTGQGWDHVLYGAATIPV